MTNSLTSAVIGSDGLIGSALLAELGRRGSRVVGTSRRAPHREVGNDLLHLDLSAEPPGALDALDCKVAYLCAAITGFAKCQDDPEGTTRINVTGAVAVAKALMANGCHVVFLSTSAVFDGTRSFPSEDTPGSPTTEYGRQKLLAEQELLAAAASTGGSAAVVRLTKVLSASQPLLRQFSKALASGTTVEAFADLRMSPISLGYTVQSLLRVGTGRLTGIFHLSGRQQLSYADFVREFARTMHADPSLVKEVLAQDRGVIPLFAPEFAALGMPRTTALGGILPQTAEAAIFDLLSEDD